MTKLKCALLGATFLASAAAAQAADIYQDGGLQDEPAAYYPPIVWSGFYAGVHAGATFDDAIENTARARSAEIDNAAIAGFHLGYNWQTASDLVLGVEGSLSFIGDDYEPEDLDNVTDYVATLRGRIGYAFDDTLIYGTGGVAFLGYDENVIADEDAFGFVVGAGTEYKLSNNLSFGIEGLYYNVDADIDPDIDDGELERDFWTVQARINYHFNSGYDAPLK